MADDTKQNSGAGAKSETPKAIDPISLRAYAEEKGLAAWEVEPVRILKKWDLDTPRSRAELAEAMKLLDGRI
jgi:hypothetical protein